MQMEPITAQKAFLGSPTSMRGMRSTVLRGVPLSDGPVTAALTGV